MVIGNRAVPWREGPGVGRGGVAGVGRARRRANVAVDCGAVGRCGCRLGRRWDYPRGAGSLRGGPAGLGVAIAVHRGIAPAGSRSAGSLAGAVLPDRRWHRPAGAGVAGGAPGIGQAAAVRALVGLPCQTNAVGRAVPLLVGLLHIARRTGAPLRLLEIGAPDWLRRRLPPADRPKELRFAFTGPAFTRRRRSRPRRRARPGTHRPVPDRPGLTSVGAHHAGCSRIGNCRARGQTSSIVQDTSGARLRRMSPVISGRSNRTARAT